ncbi:MAG TPA: fibronectin type III domain-containing protein, partial [Gemmatimonadaceae bacterium]|nr:fibronectin type III domain-containing protein [Gemmatimonadaceae bacterium]
MLLNRRMRIAALALASIVAAACGSDSTGPGKPQPILGLNATAKGATSVELKFNSVAGDDSYDIERAEGAAGTFAAIGNVAVPANPGQLTFEDAQLKPTTLYRYHVITRKGTQQSVPSGEAQTTTLSFGNAAADITTDIGASRTLFADTVYTLKGFIHVTNGATLTIEPGTKIQGDFNTLGSSLWILRGAKINAVGTATAPIVLTSSRASGRQPGDWGGL